MSKLLLVAFISLFCSMSIAQKVKIKKDIAYLDKEPFLEFKTIAFGSDYAIKQINSESDEISMLYRSYKDPSQSSTGNPDGHVRWVEVNFIPFDLKCEVDNRTRKQFIKLIYLSNIYVNGKINKENVEQFVNKYGSRFSENRPSESTTIIINH
jgi:hypothetical protein